MSITTAITLVLIAFLGGIGNTTIGPGGIFATIAVYLLLDASPGTIAGTMSVAFIGTGIVGSIAYFRSGQLRDPSTQRPALILGATSIAGAFAGAWLNQRLNHELFGTSLAAFVALTGLLILIREGRAARARRSLHPRLGPDGNVREALVHSTSSAASLSPTPGVFTIAALGGAVGCIGSLLGVGGPVLAVPLLVMLGVPMLTAVAVAQIQSLCIAISASLVFGFQNVVDWWLAALIGIPLVLGTLGGWFIAQRANVGHLKLIMGGVLIAIGAYLSF